MITSLHEWKDRVALVFFQICVGLGVSVLLLTLVALFPGFGLIRWNFLTRVWQHQNIAAGGIIQAIVGSTYLGFGVALVSFPLGLAAAIYLVEYGKGGVWYGIVRATIKNLAGVPSIIYGLFGLAFFVHVLRLGSSLLSAILTLSIMTLPWVISASVEALKGVPHSFRESSFALGATPLQTLLRIVLPVALPGCITGGIVGIARALGETAPIMLVGATFYLSGFPDSPMSQFMALPYHTFILATQHANPLALTYASGTALVLFALTLFLNAGAMIARAHLRSRRRW